MSGSKSCPYSSLFAGLATEHGGPSTLCLRSPFKKVSWALLLLSTPAAHLIQSMRCPQWEKIVPTLLPLFWPGCYACEVPAQCTSVLLLRKVSLGATATLSPCPAFHTLQHSGESRVYLGHCQSQPSSSPHSRCHQDPPNSLALSQPETVTPAWVYCWLCALAAFSSTPVTLCAQVSPGAGLGFPCPGRGGSVGCYH